MKRTFSVTLSICFVLLLVASCTQGDQPLSAARSPVSASSSPTSSLEATAQASLTRMVPQGQVYIDAKLGFQLTIPRTWQALPQPGSQASPNNTDVTFTVDEQHTHALILIGVFHGKTMPAAFAERGTPTIHLGPYPAFVADRTLGEARAPCLVRLFLAGDDYVMADWCAPAAFAFRTQFEKVLATYQPASPGFVPRTMVPPQPQTCAGMQHLLGYADESWGRQLATPTSTRWYQVKIGAFICSNEGSADWYLFQCTELANRLLYERWALPHLPGNAARYYDYYQDGILHPGTIRTFPNGSYQLSDDATQGRSAFRPVAGDLLIFQDVSNPHLGWTSGLTTSPGHVALIVGVDNTFVYVAQENYNDTQYFLALPIHRVASGYEITDLSGWSKRIVRGWIHFTVNGGSLPVLHPFE
jgi:hypothetical protein